MNGVTSRRRRQRVCSRDSAREEEEEEKRNRDDEREEGLRLPLSPLLEGRSASHRRALAPVHHLPARHQSGASGDTCTAVGANRERGRKWKNLIAPDVDTDCRSSRSY